MLDGYLFNSSLETQQLRFRNIEDDFSFLNDVLNSLNSSKTILSLVPNRVLKWTLLSYTGWGLWLIFVLNRVRISNHKFRA